MQATSCPPPLPPKRKRLTFACNQCRSKKTRCDERQPQCRNCEVAGVACVTTDKRRKDAPVLERRRESRRGERKMGAAPSPRSTPVSPVSIDTTYGGHHTSSISAQASSTLRFSEDPRQQISLPGNISPADPMDKVHLPMIPTPLGETDTLRQATQWLQIAFARIHRPLDFLIHLGSNQPAIADVPLGLHLVFSGPGLPPLDQMRCHSEMFFRSIIPLYPFISRSDMDLMIAAVYNKRASGQYDTSDIAALAIVHLVCAIGHSFEPMSEGSHATLESYILYCNTLFGHLTAHRSIVSIQVILLFAILLRLRDQLTRSYDVLLVGASMAQSLLLYDSSSRRPTSSQLAQRSDHDPPGSLCWCLYAFERILAFEVGREPFIQDFELAAVEPWSRTHAVSAGTTGLPYPRAILSLANLLTAIQQRSHKSWGQDELAGLRQEEAITKILCTAAEIDSMIQKWYDDLAHEYRAGYVACLDATTTLQRSSLLIHYYQMKVILYRNAMLRDRHRLAEEAARLGESQQKRLRRGPECCAEAAADLVRLLASSAEGDMHDYITLTASPLLAGFALGVFTINEPKSLMSGTYLEYVKLAMRLSKQQSQRRGGNDSHALVVNAFESHISNALVDSQQSTMLPGVPASSINTTFDPLSLGNDSLWDMSLGDWVSWDFDDWSLNPINP